MNCKQVSQLLLSYLDKEVSAEDREAIEAHLSVCGSCRDELGALANMLGELRQGLDEIAAGASPSPHAWWRLREKVLREEKKTPAFDIGGLRRRLTSCGFGTAVGWERAAVSVALIGFLFLGLLALFAGSSGRGSLTFGTKGRPLGPLQVSANLTDSPLTNFASYQELNEFVGTAPSYSSEVNSLVVNRGLTFNDTWNDASADFLKVGSSAPMGFGDTGTSNTMEYSQTNTQVPGVHEADIVKSDGRYIYVVLDDRVVIARAYPAENARVLSEIRLEGSLKGIFINGDRLIVFDTVVDETHYTYKTYIKVYDTSNKRRPVLDTEVAVDGQYWDSRMIGDYVYVVATEWVNSSDNEAELPRIYLGDDTLTVPAEEILHPQGYDYGWEFTTLLSFNVTEEVQDFDYLGYGTFMLGNASNMYVSQNNMYITTTEYDGSLDYLETTAVHRIHLDSGKMEYDASGRVPGSVLNRYSMDEDEAYFRIATTTGWGTSSLNRVYVLDDALNTAGALENLAQGERIYSARFMGDRCYLVTFRQVDPFFVIDLSDPAQPKLLGELKITGYSDYLHPYDENHIIGIGKETDAGLYQGVKISFFDVSDVSNPTEIAKYEIGDRGTDSPVLSEPKAFLFDREKNLMVIPVLVAEIDESKYPGGVPSNAYGDYVWQGAYVFDISLDEGLQLKGRITHYDDGYSEDDSYASVKRALYIDDVLYTISDAKIKMNDLESLDYINEADLP